jgi:hypothetical protein
MTPMMSRPLPQAARKKKPKTPGKKTRPAVTVGVVGAAAVAGCALALLLWGALRTRRDRPVVPEKDRAERISEMLEQGNDWFLDSSAVKLPKARQLLDEADRQGAKAVHYHQKSALVEFNLRSIVYVDAPAEGGDEAKKPPELEGGSTPRRGEKPVPAATNKRGEIIRGGAGDDEFDSTEVVPE